MKWYLNQLSKEAKVRGNVKKLRFKLYPKVPEMRIQPPKSEQSTVSKLKISSKRV